jgi:hypothetical protein
MLGPQHNLAQKKKGKNREAKKEQEKKVKSRRRVDENDNDHFEVIIYGFLFHGATDVSIALQKLGSDTKILQILSS